MVLIGWSAIGGYVKRAAVLVVSKCDGFVRSMRFWIFYVQKYEIFHYFIELDIATVYSKVEC